MSNLDEAWEWVKDELGLAKDEIKAIAPGVLAWAKTFLIGITPIIQKAATDGAIAAMATPGSGADRAAAALAIAEKDLLAQGVPYTANALKAAVEVGYQSLSDEIKNPATHTVVDKADSVIDGEVADLTPAA